MRVDVISLAAVGQVQGFPGLVAAARFVRRRGVLVKSQLNDLVNTAEMWIEQLVTFILRTVTSKPF